MGPITKSKAMLNYVGMEYFGYIAEAMGKLTRVSGRAASKSRLRGTVLFEQSKLAK